MKKIITVCLLVFILSACGPSPEQVQKALEETQAAAATATFTPAPATSTPEPSATPTDPNDKVREKFDELLRNAFNQLETTDHVNQIEFKDGKVIVEVASTYTEKGEIPDAAYTFAVGLAMTFTQYSEAELEALAKGEPFIVELITKSKDERYSYVTESTLDILKKVKGIFDDPSSYSIDEWKVDAIGRFE